jgi:predicted MFS family arabinose efflux permease
VSRRNLLRDGGVRALVSAETISMTGSQMTYIVLPWFVLTTTGSPVKTSLVVAAELAPVAVLGLLAGTAVTRFGARRTMLVSDVSRALLMASIPTLHLLGLLPFPLLVALVFGIGVFMVPHATAQRVIVPELVGEDEARVGEVQSLIQVAWAVAGIAGPPIGGVLIAVVGETNVLYIDAASFLLSALLLGGFVRPRHAPHAEGDGPVGIRAGVVFLFRDRLLRVWMLAITGMNVVWNAFAVIFPVLVLERYGDRPEVLGWIFGAFGAGAVLGSVASFGVIGSMDRILLASTAAAGQTAALWILLPELPWPVVAAAAAVTGLFSPILNSTVITTRTMRTPPRLRATVHAAAVTVALALAPVGALAAGPALQATSLQVVVGAVLALNTVCGVAFVVAGARERGAPAGEATAPTTSPTAPRPAPSQPVAAMPPSPTGRTRRP